MIIRLATPSDAVILTELAITTMREAFGPPHNPADLVEEYIQSAITVPLVEAELKDPRATFFLLEQPDNTVVGYAKLRRHAPPHRIPERKAVEIQRIYLSKTQIGRGQGRKLMEHCLNWAREQGYRGCWLGVWERNTSALAFYEKMDFVRFGFHYFQFGSERQRDYWLWKSLSR
ncbi:GNAT family N-acetyltransferase [Spirosoma luteum]|uniref:GNAT family N-acetyltransferase n=1 Tax=Spirosoma luteum TaxID=431553 RepID=UPI00037FB6F3|nr:GNAT family N-acetyltransferase [Spirosoma luteum]